MAEHNEPKQIRKAVPVGNPRYFDDRTALHLVQAFAQEVELEGLLKLLYSQLKATSELRGMQFIHQPLSVDLAFGNQDRHTADYNLSFRDIQLGKLVLYFARRQSDESIQTCEDLIAMAFPSLRNAVTMLELRGKASQGITQAERQTIAEVSPLASEPKTDALILLALDDYPDIKSRDGEEWAQILMSSVHEQIREGLRKADSVYHIGDDLIAVLLPHTTNSQAENVAKKIRMLIASLHLRGDEITEQLTACMGMSDATSAVTAEEVMEHAKLALAAAQAEGRNQISIYRTLQTSAANLRLVEGGAS